ncbi:caspase domain-containing protein [Aspergillus undulatus]|uniref:caspase domain-containing protein n=1 Tax=Aspergillus undulatus TaxID=1810928 RepID=UPI003CCD3D82
MSSTFAPRVLLIGIDFYQPARACAPEDKKVKINNLHGCVKDVTRTQSYLLNILKVPAENITMLTSNPPQPDAPLTDAEGTQSARSLIPSEPIATAENIRAALRDLVDKTPPCTPIYIHYSGHGVRSPTLWPELKGSNKAWDECLVPCDALCGGPVIRDVELGDLLHRMSQKDLFVTLVLDCCHSGGATRDDDDDTDEDGFAFRCLEEDWMVRDAVASAAEDGIRLQLSQPHTKVWWDKPGAYEFMAACEANQKAGERDGHGLLSTSLLAALEDAGSSLPTHGMLYRRLRGTVLSMRPKQTPRFAGDEHRVFLSGQTAPQVPTTCAPVTTEEYGGKIYLYIEKGEMHGIVKDSEYLVYPWYEVKFDESTAVATVKVECIEPTKSLLNVTKPPAGQCKALEVPGAGYQAVLHRRPPSELIRLRVSQDIRLSSAKKYHCVTVDRTSPAHYQVEANASHGLGVKDKNGQLIHNLPYFSDETSLLIGITRLERYYQVMRVEHDDPSLAFELDIENQGSLKADSATQSLTVAPGDRVRFRFKNKMLIPLHLVVVNLQPLHGIDQVYPMAQYGLHSGTIEAGSSQPDPEITYITMHDVPKAEDPVIDRFKCIISTRSIDYSFMKQDEIRAAESAGRYRKPKPLDSALRDSEEEVGRWATRMFEIRVQRSH